MSPTSSGLLSLTAWSHRLLGEVLSAGDLAVDLTAGKGSDTLFLAEQVGPAGLVLSFDIQPQAIARTSLELTNRGRTPQMHHSRKPPETERGVVLIVDDHAHLASYLPRPIRGAIANLGYLPGGDREVVTRPVTTLAALATAADRLVPGGRLAVVIYTGHGGGEEESSAVMGFFAELATGPWQILRLEPCARRAAPYLLVAEKVAWKGRAKESS